MFVHSSFIWRNTAQSVDQKASPQASTLGPFRLRLLLQGAGLPAGGAIPGAGRRHGAERFGCCRRPGHARAGAPAGDPPARRHRHPWSIAGEQVQGFQDLRKCRIRLPTAEQCVGYQFGTGQWRPARTQSTPPPAASGQELGFANINVHHCAMHDRQANLASFRNPTRPFLLQPACGWERPFMRPIGNTSAAPSSRVCAVRRDPSTLLMPRTSINMIQSTSHCHTRVRSPHVVG